jgi:hypothetical protein
MQEREAHEAPASVTGIKDCVPTLERGNDQPEPADFAGIWSDFADQDFRAFLDDIGARRREAFFCYRANFRRIVSRQ